MSIDSWKVTVRLHKGRPPEVEFVHADGNHSTYRSVIAGVTRKDIRQALSTEVKSAAEFHSKHRQMEAAEEVQMRRSQEVE